MKPSRDAVQRMAGALFALTARLDRARRQKPGASALDMLQVIAGESGIRPSEIAARRGVHPSLVTRQLKEMEDAGRVVVTRDPSDGRSWRVSLTEVGVADLTRLQGIGLDRFGVFVSEWDAAEVERLATLLQKLSDSMAAASDDNTGPGRPPATGSRRQRE